jgi:hypothetical protein
MSRIEPRPQSPIPLVERPENAPKRRREQRKPPPTDDDDEKQRKGPKSQKSQKVPDVDAERNEEELGEPGEKVDVYL